MVPAFELEEIVREARARTGASGDASPGSAESGGTQSGGTQSGGMVPGVAVGLYVDGQVVFAADGVLELGRSEPVRPQTPFRIASISKPFTASLALSCLPGRSPEPGPQLRAWLGHTAGLLPERAEPLPEEALGLFSYSNAGYWAAAETVTAACGTSFEEAMQARIIEPLGLKATGYEEPELPARGHVQQNETGHRAVSVDVYPASRNASGGLWSTVEDLLRFAGHHLGRHGPLSADLRAAMREPQSQALGAGYGLGWWVHDAGGSPALDHEGSVAGYQSLLLLVPDKRLALAVLTNSWRGSALARRVVDRLGLSAGPPVSRPGIRPRDEAGHDLAEHAVAGRYALDGSEAVVEETAADVFVRERDTDPVTGAQIDRPRLRASPIGRGVYGYAGGGLMSHRLDFPRAGIARIGWQAMLRAEQ
jgi:CubicO group peptidase (beta-lactamase class C family)